MFSCNTLFHSLSLTPRFASSFFILILSISRSSSLLRRFGLSSCSSVQLAAGRLFFYSSRFAYCVAVFIEDEFSAKLLLLLSEKLLLVASAERLSLLLRLLVYNKIINIMNYTRNIFSSDKVASSSEL